MGPWHTRVRWLRTGGATVIVILATSSCAMGPEEFGPMGSEDFGPQVTTSAQNLDSSVSEFRDVLSPYGTWVDLPDVGWVWRPDPNVVGPDFVPYSTGGQWVSSDWGWTFQTNWTWGWAPFHYGRWFISPSVGWVWWPDTEWAPAWVDWRWGDGYVGWQPLTPPGITFGIGIGGVSLGWTFVGANDFVRPDVWHYHVPPARVPVLLRQTQPVGEHVEARRGHWNRGPEPREVARVTGQPVPLAKPMTPPTGHPPQGRTGAPVAPTRPAPYVPRHPAPAVPVRPHEEALPPTVPAVPHEPVVPEPVAPHEVAPHAPAAPHEPVEPHEPVAPHETVEPHEPAAPHEPAPHEPAPHAPAPSHPSGGHTGGSQHHR